MEYFNLHITKYMDEEMSKLVAVKIIQTYTQLMKRQSLSQSSISLDNTPTLLFILDNSALKIGNGCWLVLRIFCVCS